MLVEVVNFLCVHVCHAVSYFFLTGTRWPRRTMALLWALYVVVAMALTMVLYLFFPRAAKWGVFVLTVVLHALFFGLTAEGPVAKRLFFLASYLTFFFSTVPVVFWFVHFCCGGSVWMQALARIPLYAAVILLWVRKGRSRFDAVTRGVTDGWGSLAVFSVMMGAGVAVFTLLIFPPTVKAWTEGGNATTLAGTGCALLVVAAAYYVLFKTVNLMSREQESRQIRALHQLLEAELSSEKQYVAQARAYRHDMHHHNQLLLSFANEGNLEKIRRYLKDFDEGVQQTVLPVFCRHTVINALLGNARRNCDAAGIACSMHCDIPEAIPLSDVDSCVVFGNLLENALEACRNCGNPSISVHAAVREGSLYVQVRNSVQGTVRFRDDLPVTTKAFGGVGAASMRETLSRYGGLVDFSQEGTDFVVKIILPLQP